MRKIILFLAAMFMFIGITAEARDKIEIYIDGVRLETESPAVNIDEHVLIPARAVFEALGANISWSDADKTVWADREGQFISIDTVNAVLATGVFNSDGEAYWVESEALEVAPQIIDGYTYVPVRAVSETLGAYVTWDGVNEYVDIYSRSETDGYVYYASESDFKYLYGIGKNGRGRKRLTERSVKELEISDGFVYYLDQYTNYLYRASYETGEEIIAAAPSNKIKVENGYVYYQELDGTARKSGVLYRMNTETWRTEQLTDGSVQYPEKYKNYIYFNVGWSNLMYALTEDGTTLSTVDTGDCVYSKLYPFNCVFYGDYILVEDGVWYGTLLCSKLDGSDMRMLTKNNAIIEKNQQHDDKVIYMQPDQGQDIYCINIDGTDDHLVHKGDPKWLDIEILAQWNDTVYYKHPMRSEVYRVNLDGSDDRYICYADSIQLHNDMLFSSFLGLYAGSLDGSDMKCLYDRSVKGFAVIDGTVYFKDDATSRLYMCDFDGAGGAITCDRAGEWVTE